MTNWTEECPRLSPDCNYIISQPNQRLVTPKKPLQNLGAEEAQEVTEVLNLKSQNYFKLLRGATISQGNLLAPYKSSYYNIHCLMAYFPCQIVNSLKEGMTKALSPEHTVWIWQLPNNYLLNRCFNETVQQPTITYNTCFSSNNQLAEDQTLRPQVMQKRERNKENLS